MVNRKLKRFNPIKSGVSAAVQANFPYLFSVLTPFFSAYPAWELVFYSALGLYGVYMSVNQDKVKELTDFISDHPHEFRKEIVESSEFKDGCVQWMGDYLKQRVKRKRDVLKEIILGFVVADEREEFELERLDDCLMKISLNGLQHLRFLLEVVSPLQELEIKKAVGNSTDSDLIYRGQKGINPLSKYVADLVAKEYHKPKYDGESINDIGRRENAVRDKFTENEAELISLGILRTVPTYDSQGFEFTSFGIKFGQFIGSVSLEGN